MNWDTDDMREYRDSQQKRRAERLPIRQKEIEDLSPEYEIKKITDYQYRINGIIDLYPIHRNWHNIKKNKRGTYKLASKIIKQLIK